MCGVIYLTLVAGIASREDEENWRRFWAGHHVRMCFSWHFKPDVPKAIHVIPKDPQR
jgi:hypothetical protein